jgi:hypothetical protein
LEPKKNEKVKKKSEKERKRNALWCIGCEGTMISPHPLFLFEK